MRVLMSILVAMLASVVACLAPAAAATPADVRVLIDVSGSMKRNDAENLRQPALRMLVELLPAHTLAGVWLFAEDVQALVPHGAVDQGWKAKASKAAAQIHSRGLFTHIEAALLETTRDWQTPADGQRRSLILLTDGVVDVSKAPGESEASRARLLTTGIERLRERGVTVHTIGLSDNVDVELMHALAGATDGWQELAYEAAELQRIFLRMFEQAVQPDTVPLENNAFRIDASIAEFTLLIFNPDPQRSIRVLAPDGSASSPDAHGDTFSWRVDAGYHLITVAEPAVGEWHIEAELDPDNRVMIVTDLGLEMVPIGANLLQGETIDLGAYLTENGHRIERLEFLELVEMAAVNVDAKGQDDHMTLALNGADATFRHRMHNPLAPGRYEFVLQADSQTFARQVRQRFVVHESPFSVRVIRAPTETERGEISATFDPEVVRVDDVLALGLWSAPDGHATVIEATAANEAELLFEIPAGLGQSRFELVTQLRSPSGRAVDLRSPTLLIGETVEVTEAPETVELPPEVPTAAAFDIKYGSALIGGSNLGFLLLAGVSWLCLRGPRKDAEGAGDTKEQES